ncbi:hypothetical protein FB451DRAFT_1414369 [Mycena latifolia]|nr:hypothetical protein FB451DRAFT_1414369 [Mycena latifolia]
MPRLSYSVLTYARLGWVLHAHGASTTAKEKAIKVLLRIAQGPDSKDKKMIRFLATELTKRLESGEGPHFPENPIKLKILRGCPSIDIADMDRGLGILLALATNAGTPELRPGWNQRYLMARNTVAFGGCLDYLSRIFEFESIPATVVGSWTRYGMLGLSCTIRPSEFKTSVREFTDDNLLARWPAIAGLGRPKGLNKIRAMVGRVHAHCGEGHAWLQFRAPPATSLALGSAQLRRPWCPGREPVHRAALKARTPGHLKWILWRAEVALDICRLCQHLAVGLWGIMYWEHRLVDLGAVIKSKAQGRQGVSTAHRARRTTNNEEKPGSGFVRAPL